MKKANKVLWLVKMNEELDLAASATDPDEAAAHRKRAQEFEHLSHQESPPDAPLNPDFA